MNHWILLTAVVLAGLASGAAAAEKPRALAHFRIAGDEIAVPIPPDLCEPTGAFADRAQMAAAADSQNVTLLSLFNCAEMKAGTVPQHFAYIKAPKNTLNTRMTLAELLKAMGDVPDSEMRAAIADDKISPAISKDVSAVAGKDVKVQSAILPADKDASGYYMAGVVQVQADGGDASTGVAVGITATKGHLLSYNFYAPGQGAAEVRALLGQTKAETKRLVEAN